METKAETTLKGYIAPSALWGDLGRYDERKYGSLRFTYTRCRHCIGTVSMKISNPGANIDPREDISRGDGEFVVPLFVLCEHVKSWEWRANGTAETPLSDSHLASLPSGYLRRLLGIVYGLEDSDLDPNDVIDIICRT